jgi:hypothetical protein
VTRNGFAHSPAPMMHAARYCGCCVRVLSAPSGRFFAVSPCAPRAVARILEALGGVA